MDNGYARIKTEYILNNNNKEDIENNNNKGNTFRISNNSM